MVGLNLIASLFFLAMLIGFASFVKNLGRKVHNKKFQRIIGLYMAILLLSAVAAYMIPDKNLLFTERVTAEELAEAERASRQIYEDAHQGKLDEAKGVHVNGQWSFDYTGQRLKIGEGDHGIMMVAERKAADDNKIEVVSYLTPTILDSTDFTNQIKAPMVSLTGDSLLVKPGERYSLEVARFNREFTINQFYKKDTNLVLHSEKSVMGHQVLYLRIPQNLQIDAGKSGIQFVGVQPVSEYNSY